MVFILFFTNTNRFLSSWLPLIWGQPSQFDIHSMFKIQTYLLLTKFTYFISDMYFCNKSSISGSLEVVGFFLILNIKLTIMVMPYKHMKKNPSLPTTCFAFVCVPGNLVTLTTPRFHGPSDSPGAPPPQEPPQGLGS